MCDEVVDLSFTFRREVFVDQVQSEAIVRPGTELQFTVLGQQKVVSLTQ